MSAPEIRYMPAIIRFLGYSPLPEATSWGERLVRHRTTLGMTQKEAAVSTRRGPGHIGEVGAKGSGSRRARFRAG